MTATEDLSQLSMSKLKAICNRHAIKPVGDKRLKATYILSIEIFQSQQTVTEIETDPSIELPLMEAAEMAECHTTPLDLYMEEDVTAPQPPTPKPQQPNPQHRAASVVVLIPLILLSMAVIAIRISIGALIPLIGSLIRFTGSIWQSFTRTNAQARPLMVVDPSSIPTNYFPA